MAEERLHFPSGDLHLEGVWDTPSSGSAPLPGVVVSHPHPLHGGDMNNNVVMAIVAGLAAQGIAALRFNFRGVGGSEGEHGGGRAEQDDVLAALQALRERDAVDGERIGLAGYSFGASMALGAAPRNSGVRALAVVAPPASGLSNPDLLSYAKPTLLLAGELDSIAPIEQLRSLVDRMLHPAELEVLQGGDHFLLGHEGEIAQRVGLFFAEHLKS